MDFIDSFWLCADCHILHGSGDSTSFDYYSTMQEAAARIASCQNGWVKFSNYQMFPSEDFDEFRKSPCECCESPLSGKRYEWKAYSKKTCYGSDPVHPEDSW